MTCDYIGTKQVTAWEEVKNGEDGYSVKYEDGYVSWSPKAVFEKAYICLGHIHDLPAYQQRVIGERAQLDDKMCKLMDFLEKDMAEDQRAALASQLQAMRGYLKCLDARIEKF